MPVRYLSAFIANLSLGVFTLGINGCAWLANDAPPADELNQPAIELLPEPSKVETTVKPPIPRKVTAESPVKASTTKLLSLDELSRQLAIALVEKAAAQVPPSSPPPGAISLQGVINLRTGLQTQGGDRLQDRIRTVLAENFPGLAVVAFTPGRVRSIDWLIITALRFEWPPAVTNGPRQLAVCAALLDLRRRRVLANETRYAAMQAVNLVPTRYFSDAPIAVRWPAHEFNPDPCNPNGVVIPGELELRESLKARAGYDLAQRQYNAGRYQAARITLYRLGQRLVRGDPAAKNRRLVADLGLYLVAMRQKRRVEAKWQRWRLVKRMMREPSGMQLNLALSPVSTNFIGNRRINRLRRGWLWNIGALMRRDQDCIRITGTARGKLAVESAGAWVGLAHARWAAQMLERWHGTASSRVQVAYRGGAIPVHQLTTGDARDEWDRLLHIRRQSC